MSDSLSVLAANLGEDLARITRLYRRFPAYLDDFLAELLEKDTAAIGEEELGLSFRQQKEELTARLTQEGTTPLSRELTAALSPVLAAYTAKVIAEGTEVEGYTEAVTDAPCKVAYFRNAYSNLAYSRFAEWLTDPTVLYAGGLAAACEEVFSERADLVILPVESDRDGELSTVKKLILQYELSPVYYVRITTRDGEAIRFGLFASTPLIPEGEIDGVTLLLFSDNSSDLTAFLTETDLFGIPLAALEVAEPTGGFGYTWRITLSIKDQTALTPLRILLQCNHPHHLLCGIFRNLS